MRWIFPDRFHLRTTFFPLAQLFFDRLLISSHGVSKNFPFFHVQIPSYTVAQSQCKFLKLLAGRPNFRAFGISAGSSVTTRNETNSTCMLTKTLDKNANM